MQSSQYNDSSAESEDEEVSVVQSGNLANSSSQSGNLANCASQNNSNDAISTSGKKPGPSLKMCENSNIYWQKLSRKIEELQICLVDIHISRHFHTSTF